MISLTAHAEGTVIPVRAQPGARKNAVLGERNGALRVAVSAAPERGKANEAIQQLLAEALGCKMSQVTLVQGQTSREKKFLVSGVAVEELERRIRGLIPEDLTAQHAERKTEQKRKK
ncbi:MAG: DUF167 domain-containing protein [Isosphaeraceae bacterium]|nr:DUF167 domain-containing protein [Isosphaeraceae bacterium]